MSLETLRKNISSVQLMNDVKCRRQRLSINSDASCDTTVILASNFWDNHKSFSNNKKTSHMAQRPRRPKIKMGISTHFPNEIKSKFRSTSSSESSTSAKTIVVVNNMNKTSSPSPKNEIWIDGPNEKMTRKLTNPNLILTSPEAIKATKEIWIDGPNADFKSNENSAFRSDINKNEIISNFFDTFKEKNENKIDSSESLECLDQQLLRQLNEQDMDAIDTVFKLDSSSRPISLLSVNSYDPSSASMSTSVSGTTLTNNEHEMANHDLRKNEETSNNNLTFKQKLEDLKASTDQMVFRQSCKQMESLHKTLESFLNLDQSSKMTMMMKPIKSTVLAAAYDLKKNLNGKNTSESKEQTGLLSLNRNNDEYILKGTKLFI
jgi:hypothetical protein